MSDFKDTSAVIEQIHNNTVLSNDIAGIIADYICSGYHKFDQEQSCSICNEHHEMWDGSYGDEAHRCGPSNVKQKDAKDYWEQGYCGKICCSTEACMAKFIGKTTFLGDLKCVDCFKLRLPDREFELWIAENITETVKSVYSADIWDTQLSMHLRIRRSCFPNMPSPYMCDGGCGKIMGDDEECQKCEERMCFECEQSYHCDGGCGKIMGDANDDECQRICDQCAEPSTA